MHIPVDRDLACIVSGLAGVLTVATVIGYTLRYGATSDERRIFVANLNARILAWWAICAVVIGSILLGTVGTAILFAFVSFRALGEFITLTPARRADHHALLLAFYITIPIQYWLIAASWYGLFAIFVPVYAALCISAIAAMAGDTVGFTERIAKFHWGLLICVYGLSHAPALLMLDIPGFAGQNAKLLLYLLLIVEWSDVLQYIWGKLRGRHAIAPTVSPAKTVEGFIGGIATATLLGSALSPLTPFTPWQAALMSLVATTVGFMGGLVMSAIKRDQGIKDFGTTLAGHGGMLDRVDSLCFAAPVFFHLTRYYFAN